MVMVVLQQLEPAMLLLTDGRGRDRREGSSSLGEERALADAAAGGAPISSQARRGFLQLQGCREWSGGRGRRRRMERGALRRTRKR
jgi:hypothetical protein